MAERPVYSVCLDSNSFVKVHNIKFDWHPGLSISQKQKSIQSLHNAYVINYPDSKILEISSKSKSELGVMLSAFNLGLPSKENNKIITVECFFQGSKVFEKGGPYTDLYFVDSVKAKKDVRIKDSGDLVGFNFFNYNWPLDPKTLFYDWLYVNVLYRNKKFHHEILLFDSFTDIEFNPKKSINCQARSVALFVSLYKRGIIDQVLLSKDAYIDLFFEREKARIVRNVGKQLLIPGLGFDTFF